jgi:dihydrofolate reductase
VIVSLVVAAAANEVIGADGALPWHLPGDLRRFRALTRGHVVVMGRATYQSILDRLGHPLTGRTSVVVSRTLEETGDPSVRVARSVTGALALAERLAAEAGDTEIFVIGGESVYRDALPVAGRVYLTRVHHEVPGDRAMPPGWLDGFELAAREEGGRQGSLPHSFLEYRRPPR